jgi:hypothetical protein
MHIDTNDREYHECNNVQCTWKAIVIYETVVDTTISTGSKVIIIVNVPPPLILVDEIPLAARGHQRHRRPTFIVVFFVLVLFCASSIYTHAVSKARKRPRTGKGGMKASSHATPASAHLLQQLDELFFAHLPAQLARLSHPDEDAFDLPRSLGTHERDARDCGCGRAAASSCRRLIIMIAMRDVWSEDTPMNRTCPSRGVRVARGRDEEHLRRSRAAVSSTVAIISLRMDSSASLCACSSALGWPA